MAQRTTAITGFAVLNIGIGAFFAIMSLCLIVMGPRQGAAVEAMGSGSVYAAFLWIACAAINAQLVASGVGLLKGLTWGRTLALAYGGLSLIVNGSWLFMSHFNTLPAFALIYSAALVAMCMSPQWQAALCCAGATTGTGHTTHKGAGCCDERDAA